MYKYLACRSSIKTSNIYNYRIPKAKIYSGCPRENEIYISSRIPRVKDYDKMTRQDWIDYLELRRNTLINLRKECEDISWVNISYYTKEKLLGDQIHDIGYELSRLKSNPDATPQAMWAVFW